MSTQPYYKSLVKASLCLLYVLLLPLTVLGNTAEPLFANVISGPSQVQPGQTRTYTLSGATNLINTNWTVSSNATVLSSSIYSASIKFNSTGTTTINAYSTAPLFMISFATYNVSVIAPPPVPGNPTVSSNQCGQIVLQRSGTPPAGTTWYWQGTTSNGTSTTLGSGSTYTTTAQLINASYYIRASKNGLWSIGSGSVSGITIANFAPGSIGSSHTICYGSAPNTLTNNSSASGVDGSYNYQWQYSSTGSSGWANISGATSATYNPPSGLTVNRWYRRRVISCGQTKYTGSVKVTVNPTLSAGSIGGAHTICSGEDPNTLTNGSSASGGDGTHSYQWQYSSNGTSGWTNISSATSTSYNPPAGLTADRWYRRRAISCSETKYSGNVKVTVTAGPLFYADTDKDGYGDPNNTTNACSQPSGYVANSSDHDDTTEMITSIAPQTFYSDVDGDGFGVSSPTIYASFKPLGYADNSSDQCPDSPGTTNGCDYVSPALSDENRIYTRTYQLPMSSATNIKNNSDVLESVGYFDGLGRVKQQIAVRASGTATKASSPNTPAEWIMDWTEGTGSTNFFNMNGTVGENERIQGPNPFGETDLIWRCGNEPDSGPDGGWNTDYFNVDKTKTYRYMVWVQRNHSQNGSTYHGTQNVDNLGGGANSNPYFWYGDLPQLDEWYLLVGVIHPYTHGSTDTGVSGVYDTQGNRVIDGTEYKWGSGTTTSRFRSYFYYSANVNTRQYFYRPILEVVDGNEIPLQEMFETGKTVDIVSHVSYDEYGRQDKEWLPYVAPTGSSGSNRGDISTNIQQYYLDNYADDFAGVALANVNAYSQTDFEPSPLNRVLEQAAPGKDWKLDGGHGIRLDYQSNATGEVRSYKVTLSLSNNTYAPTLVANGDYAPGMLYKNVTRDENWTTGTDHTTEEFTDKQGRVVLKRTYDNGAHDTYYVYDDFGNLTYVLPPKVVHDSSISATELAELCYQYVYDDRNRLVEKKVPGKEWEYIVYNTLDQPVLTQDAIQRANKEWLFTKYDAFGRVTYTGLHTQANVISRITMQGYADDAVTYNQYEAREGSSSILAGTTIYYSNNTIPQGITEIYTINYYDSYVDTDGLSVPATVLGQSTKTGIALKGQATVSKVRVLGTSDWTTDIIGYDVKGRPVYTASKNNYLNTTDVVETQLDFPGKAIQVRTDHTRAGQSTLTTTDNFTYDHSGRLLKQEQTIGSSTEILVKNHYNGLGQLISKETGGGLQTVDYDFNVRGWLKKINDPSHLGNDLFAFGINYNDLNAQGSGSNFYGTPLYNGNISEVFWHTANDASGLDNRGYFFEYDALNRLKKGDYIWKYSNNSYYSTDNTSGVAALHEELTYDKNGNIVTLQRGGLSQSYGYIDQLTYAYDSGNKLMRVTDAGTNADPNASDFKDGTNINDDFEYDDNGNLKLDRNKGITSIEYNHLNLPTSISLGGGTISYIYDAVGTKLKKTAGSSVTEYANGYVYTGNTTSTSLQFFNHPEGYVYKDGSVYKYVYQYKDHLGNIRLSYENNNGIAEIVEENNYYPFGLKHKGYNDVVSPLGNSVANKWKFGGKELDDSFNGELETYDFGARNYDPALGRWMNIDPLAEAMRRHSPYNYAFNNPIFFIDPDGMFPFGSGATNNWGRADPYGTGASPKSSNIAFAETPEPDKEEAEQPNDSESSGDCCDSASYYLGGYKLVTNKDEQKWFKRNPKLKDVVLTSAGKAGLKATKVTGTLGGGEGGYGDALRHAYWMYLITEEMGPEIARRYGFMHEDFTTDRGDSNLANPSAKMDLNNNEWGINFALKNIEFSEFNQFEHYFDDAVRNKEIIIINRSTIPKEPLRSKDRRSARMNEKSRFTRFGEN